jgi:hypothetical protein
MFTYTTLDGRVLVLTDLGGEGAAFFDRCITAYRDGVSWEMMSRLVESSDNPLLRATGGRVNGAVWDHPLYQAVRDLEDRVGIAQGSIRPAPGDCPELDPLVDEWVPATEAAARKGVTLPGLHKAIKRGDVAARPSGAGRSRLVVSVRSLAGWSPNRVRQAARHRERSTASSTRSA